MSMSDPSGEKGETASGTPMYLQALENSWQQLGISSPLSASMPCPIPMPPPVTASNAAAPTSPTFSLRGYLPGETPQTPQTVFPMTPAMTPGATHPTTFMEQTPSTSGESGASGTSGVPGTQLPRLSAAELLLHRQQQQRLYEAALGLEPAEGINDSIQGGSNGSGNVQAAAWEPASGRYRHLATTQLEFMTAAEELRC